MILPVSEEERLTWNKLCKVGYTFHNLKNKEKISIILKLFGSNSLNSFIDLYCEELYYDLYQHDCTYQCKYIERSHFYMVKKIKEELSNFNDDELLNIIITTHHFKDLELVLEAFVDELYEKYLTIDDNWIETHGTPIHIDSFLEQLGEFILISDNKEKVQSFLQEKNATDPLKLPLEDMILLYHLIHPITF